MVDWLERDVGPRLRRSVMDAIASDRMMIVIKAVAECDPQMDYPEFGLSRCFFCKEVLFKEASTHTENCSYILAGKIMENDR